MDASAPARPLFATEDPRLLDDLLRLAAAAGVEATVAHHAAHAVTEWNRAPAVVVGVDLLPALARLDPPPRRHVLVAGLSAHRHGAEVWEDALRTGAAAVLSLPADEPRLSALLTESAHARAEHAPVVAVIGGRGGAGASLLAIALAGAARRANLRSALVDADPLGSGLDTLLGREDAPGDRWGDLVARHGRLNWSALRSRLPEAGGIALVTWGQGPAAEVPPAAMHSVLTCAARGSDIVVADLPRGPDPGADEALRRASTVLLVVPAEVPAVFAAARTAPRLGRSARDVRLVVRESGGDVSAADVARTLDLPTACRVRADRGLLRGLRAGAPAAPDDPRSSPLAGTVDRLLSDLRSASGPSAADTGGPSPPTPVPSSVSRPDPGDPPHGNGGRTR
ncbi:septum site-determining protein Ssd [Streptomonospora salina]|uniref:Secretion/DNA translocation related CpaE-like protein n=1 Tax=Streptomonospora salina TaxID=104205 RepID=A0A841ED98_9ACTN|nr:septum site-determining protein Ssd [Streptomonospora salina]MBB5998938.1 secretion/DNA translocation related CpaE-like protein [Streptomonospora salina]